MADASPALLETTALLLSAALLSIAGVAVVFLHGGRRVAQPTDAARARRRRLALQGFVSAVAFPLVATGAAVLLLLWASPSLGSRTEVVRALITGSLGGILAGLLGAVAAAGTSSPTDPLEPSMAQQARQRALGREVAIAAGSAGLALAVFTALYLVEAGHAPPIAAAALGTVLAAIGARSAASWSIGRAPSEADRAAERSVAYGAAAAARSLALLESALVGAVLLAYIPSVVRFLEPNALLYPAVALGVVGVTGLLGLTVARIAPAGNSRQRSHMPLVAAAAFSAVALFAADSAFFYGNLGLWLSGVSGLVGAWASVEAVSWLRSRAPGGAAPMVHRAVLAGAAVWIVAAVVVAGFLFANWNPGNGSWSLDPNLGYYGVALAGLAWAALAVALQPLRVAARPLEAADLADNEAASQGIDRGLGAARLGAGTLAALGVVWALLYLDPLEYGVTPTQLLGRLGWTDPSFLLGLLLGATVPLLVLASLAYLAAPSVTAVDGRRRGPAFRDLTALWGGAIASPLAIVIVLGPGAMVGSLYATVVVALVLAVGGDVEMAGDTTNDGRGEIAELLILGVAVSALVVGGVWFASSFVGSL